MKKYPVLYQANESQFITNGLGVLSDAVQCDVTEELNGVFELFMAYPSNGRLLNDLRNNRIIYADASRELGMQPFRIYSINKLMNGFVNVYARHISYDLGGIQLPFMFAANSRDGLGKIKEYSTTNNPFEFISLLSEDQSKELATSAPKSARAFLMGNKESILSTYGGEFLFDKYKVQHAGRRGSDKGYRVRYGVNLIDLNQEESIENTYTGIFPYYKSETLYMDLTEDFDPSSVSVDKKLLSRKIRFADGNFENQKIATVDLSSYFESDPSYNEFSSVVDLYMEENKIGIPSVSLDLRYVELNSLPEYSNIPTPESVALGDTIHVDYVKLGVSATARVNTIIYDSLTHKNKRVSLGDVKNNVTDSIVKSINMQPTSQSISGDKLNLTGYVTFSSLGANGTTSIDGSRIKTGQISSEYYQKNITILDPNVDEEISAGSYWFSLSHVNEERYVVFENNIPKGGKICYFEDQRIVSTYNAQGEIIESVQSSLEMDRTAKKLTVKVDAYFSENGTMIDLANGNIISEKFSVINGKSFFGGTIKSDDADFGLLKTTDESVVIGSLGKTFKLPNGSEGTLYSMLMEGWFYYLLQDLQNGNSIGFEIGDILSTDNPMTARLIGNWKASPYTSVEDERSEIVTKQDLINLGLINE